MPVFKLVDTLYYSRSILLEIMKEKIAFNGQCENYFLEPLPWMINEITSSIKYLIIGYSRGDLHCPNKMCSSAIGVYNWDGYE